MKVSEWIGKARARMGWTYERLGEAVGRTKANVWAWEKGQHEPSISQFLRVARITNMNPAELDDWPADFRVLLQAADSDDGGNTMTGWPLSPELLAALQNASPTMRATVEAAARGMLRLPPSDAQETNGDAA